MPASKELGKDCSCHHAAVSRALSKWQHFPPTHSSKGEPPARTPPSGRWQSTATLRGTYHHIMTYAPSIPRPPQTSVNQKFRFADSASPPPLVWKSPVMITASGRGTDSAWFLGGERYAGVHHLGHPSFYPTRDSKVEEWHNEPHVWSPAPRGTRRAPSRSAVDLHPQVPPWS